MPYNDCGDAILSGLRDVFVMSEEFSPTWFMLLRSKREETENSGGPTRSEALHSSSDMDVHHVVVGPDALQGFWLQGFSIATQNKQQGINKRRKFPESSFPESLALTCT